LQFVFSFWFSPQTPFTPFHTFLSLPRLPLAPLPTCHIPPSFLNPTHSHPFTPAHHPPHLPFAQNLRTIEVHRIFFSPPAPNCSYTLDFDDGARATISTNKSENKTTHYYVNVGEYKVTLSAHPRCLPRGITATISSNDTKFANASLDCPDQAIEVTAKDESCELEVLRGSGIDVTDLISGELFATLPGEMKCEDYAGKSLCSINIAFNNVELHPVKSMSP
jgi:hypothetical protein